MLLILFNSYVVNNCDMFCSHIIEHFLEHPLREIFNNILPHVTTLTR